MSCEIDGGGLVVAAVALPAAVAFGAGWLAWQGGKLLIEGAIDRANENRRIRQEAENNRRTAAQAGHAQLVELCRGVLAELEVSNLPASEASDMKWELERICNAALPEDIGQMEHMNASGLMTLERIVSRQSRLKEVRIAGTGAYQGLAVADLMDDLRIAFAAMQIQQTVGSDVAAADPAVLERAALNRRLADVSARIVTALEFVVDLGANYGISNANNAWFQSCFNGVDVRIKDLCSPLISNAALKKGVRSLEDMMRQYDMLAPTLQKEKNRLAALYPVYKDAAGALGEPVHSLRHFKSADALEAELQRLRKRAERAEKCAEIYRKLGASAYMCYAWDEELKAMGYSVRTRKAITEMASYKPERAKLGEASLPFYRWDQQALTQIYNVAPDCDLQLIVHPDGSTTMQTIAAQSSGEHIVQAQKAHCDKIREIHRRLQENWFILYDAEETVPPEVIHSLEVWRNSDQNQWVLAGEEQRRQTAEEQRRQAAGLIGVRENTRGEEQKVMRKE